MAVFLGHGGHFRRVPHPQKGKDKDNRMPEALAVLGRKAYTRRRKRPKWPPYVKLD